ncbi:MAG: hypothetical protein K2N37_08980, partial [Lachnospiraceae bacterium]|nr:hypothetical protein [Lachnospiraceae bacterium]
MDNAQFKNEKAQKRLERIVLFALTLYTIALFVTGMLMDWNIFIKEILFLPMLAGWFVHFRDIWTHPRRATFISAMCWVIFVIYALFTDSFSTLLITMAGGIVLLSIFNMRQILYPGLIIPFFLLLYHGLIAQTIVLSSIHDIIRLIIQFFSLYMVSAILWIIQGNRQEASDLLIDN